LLVLLFFFIVIYYNDCRVDLFVCLFVYLRIGTAHAPPLQLIEQITKGAWKLNVEIKGRSIKKNKNKTETEKQS